MPSGRPGYALGSGAPAGATPDSENGRLARAETSVRGVAEWSAGVVVTSGVQLIQNELPLFALTSPVLSSATIAPNDSVADDATVHVGAAIAPGAEHAARATK